MGKDSRRTIIANRIKIAGTTADGFSIPVTDGSFTPNKQMDGITLSTDVVGGRIFLTVDSGAGLGNVGALWVNPNNLDTVLRIGNQGSQIQAVDGGLAYTSGTGSTGNGSYLTFAAGTGVGSNKDGGDLILSAGNASGGSGVDGNVTISAGGSTNGGDVTIEANNLNATLLGELSINTDPGSSGEVLTSQGAGNPPIWAPAGGSGVTSVSGTANRITSTGGSTPVIDISASYVGQTSITTLGTVTTGTWSATAIGETKGGTGQTSYTTGDILYASASNVLSKLAISANNGYLLTSDGTNITWRAPTVLQNSQSTNYTCVLSDAGKHLLHPSADTTARTFTIPANSSVAYPIGTTLTFVNQNAAGVLTIAITTDTMRLAGAGSTGSRTLAANGIATALKLTSTEWLINGTNLT